jgi:trehalose utilization protein
MTKLMVLLICCLASMLHAGPIRVVVWDERQPAQQKAYTNFIGNQIALYLKTLPNVEVRSAGLDDPDQGLSDDIITNCDVLVWWSHVKNKLVPSEKAQQIAARIKAGQLSLITLHSALTSRPFIEAMNERTREDAAGQVPPGVKMEFVLPKAYKDPLPTDPITPRIEMTNSPDGTPLARVFLPICEITEWHEIGLPSHITTLMPQHPIAAGIPLQFDLPHTETYVEPFHVPKPDAVIFQEKWPGYGDFRSGMVWKVGKGRVFYFRPGHETYPIYLDPTVLKIIGNAVEWMGQPDN